MVQRLYARDTAAENRVCCRNITFQVTSGCNLRCSYCYEHHKSVERMSIETGRKIVDYILDLYEKNESDFVNQNTQAVVLDFIGGEPLLEAKLIERICDYWFSECYRREIPLAPFTRISFATNLSQINVAAGQKLKPGDLIGVEGSTGHSTGSHLHWEIRINDIKTGYVSVYHYAGIPNMPGSAAYTSNWAAEIFGPGNLKKPTSGYPQRLYNSALQGALGINQDGVFGANTEKAVKEFQTAHGLTADGIVGTQTKAALSKLF